MSYFPSAIDLSPLGVGFRLAGKALEMFSGPEERKIINNKPYIYDAATGKYKPDLTTTEGQNAWRKASTPAIQGGKPVMWDDRTKTWIQSFAKLPASADNLPPPPPDFAQQEPPAPRELPPALAQPPNTQFPASPLEAQKPDIDPEQTFQVLERVLDRLEPLRAAERRAELERSIVTARLRNEGLDKLTSRQTTTENIRAWRDLLVAQQNARSNQAISLGTTAYLAGIPNPNVMQAMNEAMKAAMVPVAIQSPNVPTGRQLFS
jgi:hypothetical protein